eukprot:352476-Chlamydomonas_euryale.AAC.7
MLRALPTPWWVPTLPHGAGPSRQKKHVTMLTDWLDGCLARKLAGTLYAMWCAQHCAHAPPGKQHGAHAPPSKQHGGHAPPDEQHGAHSLPRKQRGAHAAPDKQHGAHAPTRREHEAVPSSHIHTDFRLQWAPSPAGLQVRTGAYCARQEGVGV